MKTYDYKCSVCEREEVDYPANKRPPRCCRKIMKKVYYPIGIHFKGKGFYVNDKENR